jgi:hypothetical protein
LSREDLGRIPEAVLAERWRPADEDTRDAAVTEAGAAAATPRHAAEQALLGSVPAPTSSEGGVARAGPS